MEYTELKKLNESVSRETYDGIKRYLTLLQKWNLKINLISRKLNTQEIWSNQIVDSLSLAPYLNKEDSIIDVGSGSGFPGIILAILGFGNLSLVEINAKKSVFLKTVADTLELKMKVINSDVQKIHQAPPKVIVSKAMTSTSNLVDLCEHLIDSETRVILLKSREQLSELEKLKSNWNYTLQVYENKYNNSIVIILSNIRRLQRK